MKFVAGAGALASVPAAVGAVSDSAVKEELESVVSAPVLRRELFGSPVRIASIELLENGKEYFVRTRTSDGAEGIAVSHSVKMPLFYPIFLKSIAPFFVGKDARDLEDLLAEVYVHESNYKMQGQAFWVCIASLEFSLLDLLGKIVRRSVGNLLGTIVRTDVAVYQASGRRGNTAADEVGRVAKMLADTGAKAAKVKLGGRMSKNADSLPGRTEALIPLLRKELGNHITLYGDSNGSYDVENSIRLGRLMEEHGYGFLEEPCPFDHYEETKAIADGLTIPIAGGECEASLRQFHWMIQNDVVQVVQPDLFYFGGLTRTIRVARMAALKGIPCTLHISGGDLGHVYMLHFASCVPNIGPFQEYKGETSIPLAESESLKSVNGLVKVPSGPGLGVTIDPQYLERFRVVHT